MNSVESLTAFLGWCTAINIGLLVLAAVFLTFMRAPIVAVHEKLFGLGEAELSRQYFQYLARYKIAILLLNLVPYLVLKIMA